MPDDLTNRTGRVINAPNGLRLHARADLNSEVLAKLINNTTFRIKSVTGKFYQIYVPATGMIGYVWKEQGSGEDAGKFYVELEPAPPPYTPPRYAPPPRNDRWGWIAGAAAAGIVIIAGLFSCSGPSPAQNTKCYAPARGAPVICEK